MATGEVEQVAQLRAGDQPAKTVADFGTKVTLTIGEFAFS